LSYTGIDPLPVLLRSPSNEGGCVSKPIVKGLIVIAGFMGIDLLPPHGSGGVAKGGGGV